MKGAKEKNPNYEDNKTEEENQVNRNYMDIMICNGQNNEKKEVKNNVGVIIVSQYTLTIQTCDFDIKDGQWG